MKKDIVVTCALSAALSAGVSYGVTVVRLGEHVNRCSPVSKDGWDHDEHARTLVEVVTTRLNVLEARHNETANAFADLSVRWASQIQADVDSLKSRVRR